MAQIHTNNNDAQVKQAFTWYEAGQMSRQDVMAQLGIKQSQFYVWLARWRKDKANFTVRYKRRTANHALSKPVVATIHRELEADAGFIANPAMPIMFYNYSAIRDAVEDSTGQKVSAQTVINYAHKWGYYIERPKNKQPHDRQVLTSYTGMLLQHDASLHQWSPYAVLPDGSPEKWSLITTLDDHSRLLLYADLFERETAWAHIQSLESVVLEYGVGIQYYSDNHAIFRYVANRDANGTSAATYQRVLGTDDIAPQWKQCVEAASMKVTYALSPEAKGKIERPYRWLQDRIVRRAARQNARTIDEVRVILKEEVGRYNTRQVHSTTKEIPIRRFKRAQQEGRSCFMQLDLTRTAPPVTSTKDIFCLRTERKVDGYGQISLAGIKLTVPGQLPDGTSIAIHIIPGKHLTEIRMLKSNTVLGYQQLPTPSKFRF